LFPDQPYTGYETFILRNAGNDWGFAHFRDGLVHRLVEHLALDVQAFRPVILFLNGEYWGIHSLRERQDSAYLHTHYGIRADAVDMLELPDDISEGSNTHYRATLDYIETHGVTTRAGYAHVQTLLDIDNFIDYNIVEIFSGNTDWPHNNAETWRYQTDKYAPDVPFGLDGRWRWFVTDMDFAFGGGVHFETGGGEEVEPHQRNMLLWATSPDGNGHGAWSTFLLRSLLANETFRHKFINRFADLLNTAFVPERVLTVIEEIAGSLAPEMPEQIRRYQRPASMTAWKNEVESIRRFARMRPAVQRQHIVEFFGLGGTATVELKLSHPHAGAIRINSLLIDTKTVGITGNPYPWQGIYFQSVPVQITAVPRFGYRFAGWEGIDNGELTAAESLEISLTQALSLTAHFEPDLELSRLYFPLSHNSHAIRD
jgi:hypothetical protein